MTRSIATIDIKQNIFLTLRERGKIVARREGHNIWLNLGREYIVQLLGYQSISPLVPIRDDRIRYIGLGIGGSKQVAPLVANTAPIGTVYPGTNNQTDQDGTVVRLERPVRIAGSITAIPYSASDVWLGEAQVPPEVSFNKIRFRRLFTAAQVSYPPFLSVPLSEVALFTNAANPNIYNNTAVAYDTFDTLSKTDAIELEVVWEIRT